MALALAFSVEERNDNKVITVTDTSGIYDAGTNPTGWGAPNPAVDGIDGSTHTLSLFITVSTTKATDITYDVIELAGPFATVADLVFDIDCSMLLLDGVASGTVDSEFSDGIYTFTYVYDYGLGTIVSTSAAALLEGRVRNTIYELYRTMPVTYNCKDCKTKEILDIVFAKAYYSAMIASAYVAREDELMDMLAVIERLITHGSSYTW
jgi:hypothetical protein